MYLTQPKEKPATSSQTQLDVHPRPVKSDQAEADALMRKLDEDIARVLDQESRTEGLDDHNADKRDAFKPSSVTNTDTESTAELNDSFMSADSVTSSGILNYLGMDSPRSELTSTGVDSQISFPLIGSSVESPSNDPVESGSNRLQHSTSEEGPAGLLVQRQERENISPRRQVLNMLSGVGSQVSQSEDNILSDSASSYHSVGSRPSTNVDDEIFVEARDRVDNRSTESDEFENTRQNEIERYHDDTVFVRDGDMSQLLQEEQDDENEDYARLLARALNSDIFDDSREHSRMEDPLENLIADVTAVRNAADNSANSTGPGRNIDVHSDNLNAVYDGAKQTDERIAGETGVDRATDNGKTKLAKNKFSIEISGHEKSTSIEENTLNDKEQGVKPKDKKLPESDLNDLEDELIGLKFASVQLSALKVVHSILCSPKYGEMLLVPNTDLTADHSKALPDGTVVRKDDDFKKVLQEFMKKMVGIATNPSPFKRVVSLEELDRVHWMLLKIVYSVRAESQTSLPHLRGR